MDAQRRTALFFVIQGVGCASCMFDWGIPHVGNALATRNIADVTRMAGSDSVIGLVDSLDVPRFYSIIHYHEEVLLFQSIVQKNEVLSFHCIIHYNEKVLSFHCIIPYNEDVSRFHCIIIYNEQVSRFPCLIQYNEEVLSFHSIRHYNRGGANMSLYNPLK